MQIAACFPLNTIREWEIHLSAVMGMAFTMTTTIPGHLCLKNYCPYLAVRLIQTKSFSLYTRFTSGVQNLFQVKMTLPL